MFRNIVLCCDGTNNQFGSQNTNIVRLAQVLERDPKKQHLYYDPGVGTLPEPGVWSATGKWISKVLGLAVGAGIFWKVRQAYQYLMDFWEPGDRVFIFGFSRGAYTARLIAALLHELGLLPRGNYNLVPYVTRLFKAMPRDGQSGGMRDYFKLCEEFRWSFARAVPESWDDRRFRVHFLGLWDTVSSVGWLWERRAYPFTAKNPSVDVIRHAVSIDERRWFFRQNVMQKARPDQDLVEQWFPGVHSDVGGGYPEAGGGLWREPFGWILEEAQSQGLRIDAGRLQQVLNKTAPSVSPCFDEQHESLTAAWWIAEFFPKLQWRARLGRRVPAIGLGGHRFIKEGALIHRCALSRLQNSAAYRPPNLSPKFVGNVQRLQQLPESLPYDH